MIVRDSWMICRRAWARAPKCGGKANRRLPSQEFRNPRPEEETNLDDVPATVKAELEARSTVRKIETVTKGRTVTYEAVVERGGKRREVAVSAAGKTIK